MAPEVGVDGVGYVPARPAPLLFPFHHEEVEGGCLSPAVLESHPRAFVILGDTLQVCGCGVVPKPVRLLPSCVLRDTCIFAGHCGAFAQLAAVLEIAPVGFLVLPAYPEPVVGVAPAGESSQGDLLSRAEESCFQAAALLEQPTGPGAPVRRGLLCAFVSVDAS
jgi:hypothetical protein